jgi:hypothetical protein
MTETKFYDRKIVFTKQQKAQLKYGPYILSFSELVLTLMYFLFAAARTLDVF